MPVILLVGPFVALIGIGAIYFVLHRKAVDKRSMYSARRSQIEHKVRAARQRTLVQHGHPEAAAQAPAGAQQTSIYAPPAAPGVTYEPSAYEPPPAAPPSIGKGIQEAPAPSPWDVGPTAPAPSRSGSPKRPSAQPVRRLPRQPGRWWPKQRSQPPWRRVSRRRRARRAKRPVPGTWPRAKRRATSPMR